MSRLVNKQPTTPYPASFLTICCIFSVTVLKDGDCDKMFKAENETQNLLIYYNPFLFKGKKKLFIHITVIKRTMPGSHWPLTLKVWV